MSRTVSTPFIYRPRSRPAVPLPGGLTTNFTHPSAIQNEDWTAHQATMKVKSTRGDDIVTKVRLFKYCEVTVLIIGSIY